VGKLELKPLARTYGAYQSGDKVIFQFTGVTVWDFYNVRYDLSTSPEAYQSFRRGHRSRGFRDIAQRSERVRN
jgi:hypothetical protein